MLVALLGLITAGTTSADLSASGLPPIEPYCQWQQTDFMINEPLCGLKGIQHAGALSPPTAAAATAWRATTCRLPMLRDTARSVLLWPVSAHAIPEGYIRLRGSMQNRLTCCLSCRVITATRARSTARQRCSKAEPSGGTTG